MASALVSALMDDLLAMLQRLERRSDANEQRAAATRPPRPDPDPPYVMPWGWKPSSWTPAGTTPFSEPYTESARQEFGAHQYGFVSRSSATAFPSSWDPPTTQTETRGPSSPSSPYEFDPILGRPLTSWDLPRPRIESYGGGGWSQFVYGASRIHGGRDYVPYSHYGGGYSPYLHYGGGYSGGSYAREHNPYAPSPPPPRDDYYVSAPQPNPPSYTHPQQSWELSWSRTAPDSLHIVSDYDFSSTHAHGTIVVAEKKGVNLGACAESEAGVVDGMVAPVSDESVGSEDGDALNPEKDEVGEEKGDFVANDSEVGVKLSNDSNGSLDSKVAEEEEDFNSVVQSSAAVINDNEREKSVEFTNELIAGGSKAAKEGNRNSGLDFEKIVDVSGGGMKHGSVYWAITCCINDAFSVKDLLIWMNLMDIQERAWTTKSLEVTASSDGSVKVLKFIFGLYELAEVYKEFESPP